MTGLNPYLFFDGNCIEAMNFYKKCLGGELFVITYGEAQKVNCPPAQQNRALHAALRKDNFLLMASDTTEDSPKVGGNVYLYLQCESPAQLETYFKALSEGGTVSEPLHDVFWGAHFGMIADKYGFHWMLAFAEPK